jgi:pimeloyl-ACP methyl ester carboxylesterase
VDRPRLLLVPEITELEWEIRPRLETWAEVAYYDPPGVGDEPLPPDVTPALTRDLIVWRGLEELNLRGWRRFMLVGDGWGIASAARIAHERRDDLAGLVLGHARLSYSREGERAPVSAGVWEAITQLLRQDQKAFIRHGIAQATGGSVNEDLAQRMLERIPSELMLAGWESLTADDEPFAQLLEELDCPMLLGKHEGCLMSPDEGFEDAAAAFPEARTIAVTDAPQGSAEFADAIRAFCDKVWEPAEAAPGHGESG